MLFTSKLRLNEELSVSNNVIQLTELISNKIQKVLKNTRTERSKDYNRIFKKGELFIKTIGIIPNVNILHIYFHVYYFKDNNDYRENKVTLDTNCFADFNENMITLRLVMINDKPDDNFNSSIQHEVNHIYQYANGATKDEELYKKVTFVAKDKTSTEIDQVVAYALYLTFPTEQDSFVNQYYAFLKQKNVDWDEVYNDFPEDDNNPYNKILDIYDYLYNIRLTDSYMRQKFGISLKQFYIRLENADKRLRRKLIKAATRWRNDAKNESYLYREGLFLFKDPYRMNFIMECYKKGIVTESSEYDD